MKKLKKEYFYLIMSFLFLCIFLGVVGISYAFLTTTAKGKQYVMYTGNLEVEYQKKTDTINIENAYPMTNQQGLDTTPHTFTVTNTGNVTAKYQIRLELEENVKNQVPLNNIKMSFQMNNESESEPILLSNLETNLVFTKNVLIKPGESHTYGMKLWIDINAGNEIQGKTFSARVVVDSIQELADHYEVDTRPNLTLKEGTSNISLKVNDDYQDLGVEKIEDDQEIFTSENIEKTIEYFDGENQELKIVGEVDTSKTGVYYITYKVTDKSNNIGQVVRVVTVNETLTRPNISLKGNEEETIYQYSTYIDSGVNIEEKSQLITIGEVKTSVPGTYTVRYIVVGQNNQMNSITRTVIVIPPYQEELLNGAYPILTDNLIPVTIEDDGTVKKADIYEPWYSYESQEWANSVVVRNSYDTLNSYGKVHSATKEEGYVSFDGKDDYIDLGFENYDFQNAITLAVRVKINEIPINKQYDFFGNWDSGGGGFCYTNDSIFAQFYINGGYKLASYSIANWEEFIKDYHTLVTTYDGNTIKLYIDGKEVAKNEVFGTIQISPVAFALGADFNKDGNIINYSNVNIKSAAIYDRTLDEEEIAKSFTDEIQIYHSENLLVYEDFREKEYENNEVIPEDSIESYFVWIPKYSYQIWDLGIYEEASTLQNKAQEIKIKFGLKNTSNSNSGECTTPGVAGAIGSCKINDYMTHPAFLAFASSGFWVGKFETGYEGANTTKEAEVNSPESDKIIIKPNVYSWRGISVGNAFQASYDYLRDEDSHMMKNTEWGAVAYLQHSKYGSATSVRINNNNNYITGYAATEEPEKGFNNGQDIEGNHIEGTNLNQDGNYTKRYNSEVGYTASTTGNITGIYDMSGGGWEYVMGYNNQTTKPDVQNEITKNYPEFFTDDKWKKYYDSYTAAMNNNLQYNNRILGDATGEMGPFGQEQAPNQTSFVVSSWYKDYAYFVGSTSHWFIRSAVWHDGTYSGIFSFSAGTGEMGISHSFRLVLTP